MDESLNTLESEAGVLPTAEAGRDTPATAEWALSRAREHLLDRQAAEGWWKGELETNVTMDAEDLFLREFLGVRDPVPTERTATWIRSQQRADGSWANFFGGPADLSTTVEAYVALRLAGDPVPAEHMRRAATAIRELGGVEAARVFTHLWLALLGLWPWAQLPALPPEIMLLPRWVPLNIYDFACWARQTIVAVTVVSVHRPVHPVPFGVHELRSWRPPSRGAPPSPRLAALDRVLRRYERRPVRAVRRHALDRAERWIVERQEADGSWGGIQPPWVYSLLALRVRGYALDHPVMQAGLAGLERFTIDDDRGRRLEACQSPVWDTALAMVALTDAGLAPDHPALVRATDWLLDEEVRVPGDWTVRRPDLTPGGWAFEFENDTYPDVDDTAEVVLALRRVRHPDRGRVEAAVARGVDWTLGMQCRDGGWGAFDVDNDQQLCRELPFLDFGEVIDPPSADVTAHALEMLTPEDRAPAAACRRAQDWLLAQQESDGSWFGRWGANHLYGTGAAIPALVAAGVPVDHLAVRRAVRWLEQGQNPDGGWGEDCRSYRDPAWVGQGESTASQTAWALLALLAAGEGGAAVERGVDWLVRTQTAEGTWDEPQFTGTGFPGDFLINYHLYRDVFPLMALGRYRDAQR